MSTSTSTRRRGAHSNELCHPFRSTDYLLVNMICMQYFETICQVILWCAHREMPVYDHMRVIWVKVDVKHFAFKFRLPAKQQSSLSHRMLKWHLRTYVLVYTESAVTFSVTSRNENSPMPFILLRDTWYVTMWQIEYEQHFEQVG